MVLLVADFDLDKDNILISLIFDENLLQQLLYSTQFLHFGRADMYIGNDALSMKNTGSSILFGK